MGPCFARRAIIRFSSRERGSCTLTQYDTRIQCSDAHPRENGLERPTISTLPERQARRSVLASHDPPRSRATAPRDLGSGARSSSARLPRPPRQRGPRRQPDRQPRVHSRKRSPQSPRQRGTPTRGSAAEYPARHRRCPRMAPERSGARVASRPRERSVGSAEADPKDVRAVRRRLPGCEHRRLGALLHERLQVGVATGRGARRHREALRAVRDAFPVQPLREKPLLHSRLCGCDAR